MSSVVIASQTIAVAPGNRYTAQVAIFATSRPYAFDLELAARQQAATAES